MKTLRMVSLFVCLLGVPTGVVATTYHVSPSGDDARSCAQAQNPSTPRKTWNGGMQCLASGDMLLIGPGTYPERIAGGIPSGTAQQHTTIRGSGIGGITTLTGGTWTGQFSDGIIGYFAGNYITFERFTIDPNYAWPTLMNADGNIGWLVQDVEMTRAAGITIGAANFFGTTFRRLHIHHCGIYDKSTVGLPLGDYYPYRGFNHAFYLKGGGNNIIEDSYIHDLPDGYAVQNYDHGVIIRNNVFRNVSAAGIAVNGQTSWYNNIFDQTGQIVLKGTGNIFHHNAFFTNFIDTLPPGPDYEGPIGLYFSEGQVDFRNNLLFGKTGNQRPQGLTGQTAAGNLCDDGTYGGTCTIAALSTSMFVQPDAQNYRLKAGAAAIDVGQTLTATYVRDLYGFNRPFGAAWDVGPAEYTQDTAQAPCPARNLRVFSSSP